MHLDVEFSESAMAIGIVYGFSTETIVKRESFLESPKQTCTLSTVVQVSSKEFYSSVFVPYAFIVLGIHKF